MRTLLLADDSITVQRVIALTFAEEPIRVVTVSDGQQAIERMAAQKPDIVLAGTTLPQVSGYDLARFMRSKPELRDVPVLLLSGAFESVDAARLKASGASGVLEKPVEPTIVIGRVKELLGLKGDAKPPASGRLVTPAAPAERKTPVSPSPPAVTSTRGTPSRWEQLRDQTGLDPNTRSVEDPSTRADDYLDTLDAAFDTLDQQLSGRAPSAKQQRNPSGPLGQAGGAPDPRSPGRSPHGAPQQGNQVFEVDDEWFGGADNQNRVDGRGAAREITEELRHPELRGPDVPAPAATPIYEVDEAWFAEDDKARAERLAEQQRLTAEMGIHEVELLKVAPPAPPVSTDNLRFSIDDIAHQPEPLRAPGGAAPPPMPAAIAPLPSGFGRDIPREPEHNRADAASPRAKEPVKPVAPATSKAPAPQAVEAPKLRAPRAPAPQAPTAPQAPRAPVSVADDFAALLAFEQGERPHPPVKEAPAANVKVVAPEITEDMLDQIAARVADRLSASAFGHQLKDAMAATMKDTVRSVVSETSERLVREEIERIRSKNKG